MLDDIGKFIFALLALAAGIALAVLYYSIIIFIELLIYHHLSQNIYIRCVEYGIMTAVITAVIKSYIGTYKSNAKI